MSVEKKASAEALEKYIAEAESLHTLIEDFNKSEIAKRFAETLDKRMDEVMKDLQVANDIKDVKLLQGEGKGLAFWREMPTVMVETLQAQIITARAELAAEKETGYE